MQKLKAILNNEKYRNWLYQFLALFIVVGTFYYLFHNTQANLAKQSIATGFGFLNFEAGFEIGESIIDYWSDDTYLVAIWAGVLNTFKVAVIGNLFALVIGVLVGLCYLSDNWLVRKFSKTYIEVIRNIPLLLQLFFWYAIITEMLPSVRNAYNPLPNFFLSNRGAYLPFPENTSLFAICCIVFVISAGIFFWLEKLRDKKIVETGVQSPLWEKVNYLIFLLPFLVWLFNGAPNEMSLPKLQGFNFSGGYNLTPEFSALVLGLVIYTSAFNAEITRAGISSIGKGQWEACESLGLSKKDSLRLVILPQALRVMIPPLTSQVLNLTKNSSLAVAIGYPDVVSVINTTMNQTGQAVECVFMIMFVYLIFSLSTSLFMNWFNKKWAIVER